MYIEHETDEFDLADLDYEYFKERQAQDICKQIISNHKLCLIEHAKKEEIVDEIE